MPLYFCKSTDCVPLLLDAPTHPRAIELAAAVFETDGASVIATPLAPGVFCVELDIDENGCLYLDPLDACLSVLEALAADDLPEEDSPELDDADEEIVCLAEAEIADADETALTIVTCERPRGHAGQHSASGVTW